MGAGAGAVGGVAREVVVAVRVAGVGVAGVGGWGTVAGVAVAVAGVVGSGVGVGVHVARVVRIHLDTSPAVLRSCTQPGAGFLKRVEGLPPFSKSCWQGTPALRFLPLVVGMGI